MDKEKIYGLAICIMLVAFVIISTALTFLVFYVIESMVARGVLVFTLFIACGYVFMAVNDILER